MLSSGIILIIDNTCSHAFAHIVEKIRQLKWELFDQPHLSLVLPWTPHLIISNLPSVAYIPMFEYSEELKTAGLNWLK